MSTRPILFNTEMVRAILEGRKSVTRRKIDAKSVEAVLSSPCRLESPELSDQRFISCLCTAPCEMGDILWVRETWNRYKKRIEKGHTCHIEEFYGYKASPACSEVYNEGWHPSIHMPREAARLFLRVTAVRVERLQEIDNAGAKAEGVTAETDNSGKMHRSLFVRLWNSTIQPADLPRYGWAANPWVWVIEFERCEKPEGWEP